MSRQFFPTKRTYLGVSEPLSTALPTAADKASTEALQRTVDKWMVVTKEEDAKRDQILNRLEALFREFVRETCVRKKVDEGLANEAGGRIEPFGSYLLGVDDRDSDIDVVCVGPKFVTREDFFTGFVDVLNREPEVSVVVAVVDAFVPVVNLVFSGIEVDLVYVRVLHAKVDESLDLFDGSLLEHLDERCVRSLNGLRVSEEILSLVPDVSTFQLVLKYVKVWAKRRAVYSNIVGFLGGVAWAIAVARVCQLYPNAAASVVATKFFSTLFNWDWSQPLILKHIKEHDPLYNSYEVRRHLMPILTPSYPCMCATHNVTSSTFQTTLTELKRALLITEMISLGSATWSDVLDPSDYFEKYKHYIQIIVSSNSAALQFKWSGLVESRIRPLALKLEMLSESVELVQPFSKSIDRAVACKTMEEAAAACTGIVPEMDYINPITTIYTSTFYIALQFGSPSEKSLNLSLPIQEFVDRVKGWDGFDMNSMGLVIHNLSSSEIPQNLLGESKSKGVKSTAISKQDVTNESTSNMNGEEHEDKRQCLDSPPAPAHPSGVLFIGGLDVTITEFRLKKIFEKFGQITKFEYHWHKVGPRAGHPKGSAFIKFSNENTSLAVISALNGTVPSWNGGRKLSVAWSKVAEQSPGTAVNAAGGVKPLKRPRTRQEFEQRALEASINKKVQLAPSSAESHIAAIERKLKELEEPTTPSTLQHPLPPRPNGTKSGSRQSMSPSSKQTTPFGPKASSFTGFTINFRD
ncbi:polynucleotide adenylyltransferase [Rhizoclosmatium sp. JEL0117]|nr:polynucleotide adenylyltransferase [Rhizoclosmatium sp. JEL0117]